MTTAKKSNSVDPARSAAARKAAETRKAKQEAEAAAELEQAQAAAKAAHAKAMEAFNAYDPGEAVLDEDGYEIVPDRSKQEGGTYKFTVNGERYELPSLQYLPLDIAQKLPHMDEAQAMNVILGRYAPGLMSNASADQFMHISKRWTAFSQGLTLGE